MHNPATIDAFLLPEYIKKSERKSERDRPLPAITFGLSAKLFALRELQIAKRFLSLRTPRLVRHILGDGGSGARSPSQARAEQAVLSARCGLIPPTLPATP